MKFKALLGMVGLALAAEAGADSWSTGGTQPSPSSGGANWEQKPAGTDSPGLIDDYIRDLKWEVRRRGEVELHFGPSSGDNGLLREGAARAFIDTATANVDNINDGNDGVTVSPGFYNAGAETNTTGTLTTAPSGWTQPLGVGRMMFDSDGPAVQEAAPTTTTDDDYKLYVWDNAAPAGWKEAKAQHDDVTELSRTKVGAVSQVACGDFDCAPAASTAVPPVNGWASTGTATFSYAGGASSEGTGLRFRIVSTGTDKGAQFTMRGLKNGITYTVTGRVAENVADDVCSIFTTGATTNMSSTDTSATGTYETITGSFVAGAANVVLNLVGDAAGGSDTCDFDHIGVFEQATPAISTNPPTAQYAKYTTDSGVIADGVYTTVGTLDITVPSSNYGVRVRASACADIAYAVTSPEGMAARIQENAATVVQSRYRTSGTSGITMTQTLPLEYINTNTVSGTQYTYTLQMAGDGSTLIANGGATCESSLMVELVNF